MPSTVGRRPWAWVAAGALVLAVPAAAVAWGSGDTGEEAPAQSGDDLLAQGLDAWADGDAEAAVGLFEQASEAEPQNPLAHFNLGIALQRTEQPAEAEAAYRRAIDADPNLAPALYNLALLRTQAAAPNEAVQLYQRVTTLEPDNAPAHLNLGLLLLQLGRTDEGDAALATADNIDPGLAERVMAADPDEPLVPDEDDPFTPAEQRP